MTEAELRDLYDWAGQVLGLALAAAARSAAAKKDSVGDDDVAAKAASVADLLQRIGRMSGSREQAQALASLNDRLAPIRTIETRVFSDCAAEASMLWDAYRRQDWRGLRRDFAQYHRRRRRAVPELLEAARAWRASD